MEAEKEKKTSLAIPQMVMEQMQMCDWNASECQHEPTF